MIPVLQGIQYVTDLAGKPIAVQIDLRRHKGLWEDFCDVMVAQSRKSELHSDWNDVKKRLKKSKRK